MAKKNTVEITGAFKDKKTGQRYNVKDIVEFSDSRIKDIQKVEKDKKVSLIRVLTDDEVKALKDAAKETSDNKE